MPNSKTTPALPPAEERRCNELIRNFENQLPLHRGSRLELGHIARELKPLYVKAGRKGGWSAFVTSHGQKVRTVDEWILDYERDRGFCKPAETKRVKPPKKRSRGNVADSATFLEPEVNLSGKPFKDGKEIVEAIFVLTKEEKRNFIDAVRRLGPMESTWRMYEALVAEKKTARSVALVNSSELGEAIARHAAAKGTGND